MPWAITPRGVGNPVGARRIREGWPLVEGETFVVPVYEPARDTPAGPEPVAVLAEDERSLRSPTPEEVSRYRKSLEPRDPNALTKALLDKLVEKGSLTESDRREVEERSRGGMLGSSPR